MSDCITDDQFWMVWCPRGRAPVVRHDSERKAINEAERLAQVNPGSEFFILKATEMRIVNNMRRVILLTPDPEFPF